MNSSSDFSGTDRKFQ